MYVCICNAVTDKQIRHAVNDGASTMRELRQRLGVAGNCGRCACAARDILRQQQATTDNYTALLMPALNDLQGEFSFAGCYDASK